MKMFKAVPKHLGYLPKDRLKAASGTLKAILGLWLACLPGAAVEAAPPAGRADIVVEINAQGADAAVSLDRAVTSFDFADVPVVREGEFTLLTPGLALAGNKVSGAKPFRRFSVRIGAMKQERDAKYPAHFRIGGGGVVYAPALKADTAVWRTRIRFRTRPGQIRLPASGPIGEGFVFVGPSGLRSESAAITVVADPKTPAWLVETTRTGLETAVASFTAALGAPLPRKPLLIIRHDDGPRSFNVGDVTPGGVTSLRFHGASWTVPDETAAKAIQSFLHHEAFHFWNGGLTSPAKGTPAWLHEGGAEYAALLAEVEAGKVGDEEALGRLTTALQRCRAGLENAGDRGMSKVGFLSNQIRYPCGMVLQWAVDLRIRSGGDGRTVMGAWAETIRAARGRPSPNYGLSDFLGAAGIAEVEEFGPVVQLVKLDGPGRWRSLMEELNRLGAEVVQSPSPNGRRQSLLFHLLRQNCTNLPDGTGFGFYTDSGGVRLQSPSGCGVLAGDPPLKSLEGGDPFAPSPETYSAVQRKCAAGSAVTFVTTDGRTLEAECKAPLAPEPQDFLVRRWRPPPASSAPDAKPARPR